MSKRQRSCGPTGAACEEVPGIEDRPRKDRFQRNRGKGKSPEKKIRVQDRVRQRAGADKKGENQTGTLHRESKDSGPAQGPPKGTSKGASRHPRGRPRQPEVQGVQGIPEDQKSGESKASRPFRGVQELQKFR